MIDKQLRDIVRQTNFRFVNVIFSAFISTAGAALEALSMIVLIPIVNLVMHSDAVDKTGTPIVAFLGEYVDSFAASETGRLAVYFSVFALLVILKLSLVYCSSLITSYSIRGFINDLRQIIFDGYLNQSKAFFDRVNAGKLYQVLVTQTEYFGNELKNVGALTTNLLMLFAYGIVLFSIHWKITLIALVILPVLNISVTWLIKKIKRTSRDRAHIQNELGEQISNTLSSIPLIKAYCNEDEERQKFGKLNKLTFHYTFSIDKKLGLMLPLQEAVITISVIILLFVMTMLFQGHDGAVLANVLVYFFVLKRASNLFGTFNDIRAMFSNLAGPWEEIKKMLYQQPELSIEEGTHEFKGLQHGVQIRNLQFAYHADNYVLKDVTAFIEKGKMTAFVGETGAGKSTIANILMRYYECPSGSVFFDDMDIRDFTVKSLRSKIAIVNQDPVLFNGTIKDNILYGIHEEVPDSLLEKTLERARLGEFIRSHSEGLQLQIGDRGVQLSGGERQRLAIARAMLKGADIFLLDEPTSALDSKTEELIQQAIDEMTRGKTTIVIAHRLSTIKKADHIIVMQRGSVVESGNPEELRLKKGVFFQYLEAQKLL